MDILMIYIYIYIKKEKRHSYDFFHNSSKLMAQKVIYKQNQSYMYFL
jgi:hypothetical protein